MQRLVLTEPRREDNRRSFEMELKIANVQNSAFHYGPDVVGEKTAILGWFNKLA